jgi:hypothetical protein
MGTIGLAHRTQRDFVVEWLEAEEPAEEPTDGLTEQVEVARARARAGDHEELARRPGEARAAGPSDALETWLAGEPTF